MSGWQGFILGIVQGLTEFLPISSSGHLVLFQRLLKIQHHDLAFDMVVHVATLIAIVFVFRNFLLTLLKQTVSVLKTKQINKAALFVFYIVVGTIPAGVIGVAFKDFFEQLFESGNTIGYEFIIMGIILYFTPKSKGNLGHYEQALEDIDQLNVRKSLIIGFAQALAISPAISRSGMTIVAGLLMGLSPRLASVYSFTLSIPVIAGAAVLMLRHIHPSESEFASYGIGFLASLISGIFALVLVIKIVKHQKLEYFSYYLWALGLVVIFFKGSI